MKIKKLGIINLLSLIDFNFCAIHRFIDAKNISDLYKETLLINAVTFRVEVLCRLVLKYRNDLNDLYDEKDILYLQDLLNLLKDYTKLHSPDLWYFVNKRMPYFNNKIGNN